MKKLLIIMIYIPIIVFGQNSNTSYFSIKSGCSISSVDFSSTEGDVDKASRTGFMFGVFKQYGKENLRANFELLINQQGDKDNIHFNYLDFAVKANYLINNKISLKIGPSFSYLFNGEWNDSPGGSNIWEKIDFDEFKQDFNRFGYSTSFGLCYDISKLLGFGFSYNIMLNPIIIDNSPNLASSKMTSSSSFIYLFININ